MTVANINQASGLVLDHIMNNALIQACMDEYIKTRYPNTDFDMPAGMDEAEWEDSVTYALYYAATVEFHSGVLARAVCQLTCDPL